MLGIHEGKSPALVRDVGRLTALLPSYEAVQHELSERGVAMRILGGGTYDTPKIPDRKYFNDVWSSADAVSWTRRSEEAPWQARQYHDVAAFDGRMWVLEGYYKEGGNRKDAWYSGDGLNWYEVPNTPWAPRHAASVYVHDGCLWMVAGNNMQSDVWKLRRKAAR